MVNPMRPTDRSSYVHAGLKQIGCRFELCRHAAKAARILHTRDRRIQDTMNLALTKVRRQA